MNNELQKEKLHNYKKREEKNYKSTTWSTAITEIHCLDPITQT